MPWQRLTDMCPPTTLAPPPLPNHNKQALVTSTQYPKQTRHVHIDIVTRLCNSSPLVSSEIHAMLHIAYLGASANLRHKPPRRKAQDSSYPIEPIQNMLAEWEAHSYLPGHIGSKQQLQYCPLSILTLCM